MQVECPQCNETVNVADEQRGAATEIACPSCGSHLPLIDLDATNTYRAPTKKIGHFELLERVGTGSFGTVWKARDTTLERIVAVKIPRMELTDDKDAELFRREARSAARLSHTGIVAVHEIGQDDQTAFIVSDFVQGPTLKEWLAEKRMSPRESAEMGVALAEAVQHAPESGVIHRDLKPGNILLSVESGGLQAAGNQGSTKKRGSTRKDKSCFVQPKITDFGLAKRFVDEATLTLDGELLGTPSYMSPEQAAGRTIDVGPGSDVYSLGVILYEMLVGEQPFAGAGSMLLHKVIHEEPRTPRSINRDLPRDLETICLKAMSKRPEDRYGSAGRLAEDLKRFLDGRPILARRTSLVVRAIRWGRRHKPLAAAVVMTLVAAAAVGTLLTAGFGRNDNAGSIQPGSGELTTVHVITEPAGARIALVPLGRNDGDPQEEAAITPADGATTPVRVDVPPGNYLVVAEKDAPDGYMFHEVFRTVPSIGDGVSPAMASHLNWSRRQDQSVELPVVKLFRAKATADGMWKCPGGTFVMGTAESADTPPHQRHIDAFLLEPLEVTIGRYQAVVKSRPELCRGMPEHYAVRGVRFDAAVAFAEKIGLRLPTEAEFEFAGTRGGKQKYPWGGALPDDAGDWEFAGAGHPEFDQTDTSPPVYGLYSNVAEWTSSWPNHYPPLRARAVLNPRFLEIVRQSRVVRGGTTAVMKAEATVRDWLPGPRKRQWAMCELRLPGVGFRCARSERARFLPPSKPK